MELVSGEHATHSTLLGGQPSGRRPAFRPSVPLGVAAIMSDILCVSATAVSTVRSLPLA
jgi:hypothetical protein